MATEQVVISDVRIKQLNDGRELFIVKDAAGNEYSTMKRELAEKAKTWKGGSALITFDVKQKQGSQGQTFTNRYLNDVQLPAQQNGNDGFTVDTPQGAEDDTKRVSIAKAVALKASIDLASHGMLDQNTPTAIIQVADFFVAYLLAGYEQMAEDDIPF